jgi:hypothetical protein
MCTSGCGTFTASTFSFSSSVAVSGRRAVFQYISPSRSTAITMFSGLVCVTWLRSSGSLSGTVCVTTGMVIRKMISSTSITSTNGVVLIAETTSSSSLDSEPTFMPIATLLRRVL